MQRVLSHFRRPDAVWVADILRPDRNSFGVIRLAMAVAVLISHSYFFVSGDSTTEPLVWLTGHSLGEHAVQVFFVLSGILVTESLLRSRGAINFFCGRCLRIFPGLIVCVALTALVLGPLVSQRSVAVYFSDPQWAAYVVKTILLVTGAATLPGTFGELPAAGLVNMSLWTLKYEVICYLGLGAIGVAGLLRERFRMPATAILAVVLCGIYLRAPDQAHAVGLVDHVRYFALYFGMGTLVCLLKDYIPVVRWVTLPLLALFLASVGMPWAELTCAVFLAYATIVAATFSFGSLRAWCNRHDVSFGVYIYAAPIQQALLLAFPGFGPLTLSAMALAISALFARLSWDYIEKPAMALRPLVSGAFERLFGRTAIAAASVPRA